MIPMKTLLIILAAASLILLPFLAFGQSAGQSVIDKKNTGSGFTREAFTLGNSQVIGRTSAGTLSGLTIGTGLTLTGSTITATGGGTGGATALDELTDVTLTTPAVNHFLVRGASDWVNLSPASARTALELGTLATQSATLSDYLTTATAATSYQPLDTDLTSIAALTTTTFGRSLLTQSDAAAVRSLLGLGTLATQSGTLSDYLTTATASTSYQPLHFRLTYLAGVAATATGRSVYEGIMGALNMSIARSALGLSGMSTQDSADVFITGGYIAQVRYHVGTGLLFVNDVETPGSPVTTITTSNVADITLALPTTGTLIMSDAMVSASYQPLDADLTDLADGTLTGSKVSSATTSAVGVVELATNGETASSVVVQGNDTRLVNAGKVEIGIAISDETTALTTGTAKATFRMPHALTLTAVRLSLTTASSSGLPTIDINESGTTVISTKLTCDATEKTSTTAATAAVISDSALADDAEITIDIDVAGTGATGAKVWLIGTR